MTRTTATPATHGPAPRRLHVGLRPGRLLERAAIAAIAAIAALAAAPARARADAPRGGPKPATSSADLRVECLRYEANQQWAELDGCADRLKGSDPARAKELKTRAVMEIRSAPRVAGVEAALRDNDLKRAKLELDQVWTGAAAYLRIKSKYVAAEDAAIVDLVARLERVRGGDCKEYKALLAQARATKPPRVSAEAQGRVKCAPPPPPSASKPSSKSPSCDADALSEKGRELYAAGQYAAALTSFEAAIACRADPALFQRAFAVSCNLHNVAKAKVYWKRMTPAQRRQAAAMCVRNGITEDQLDAP